MDACRVRVLTTPITSFSNQTLLIDDANHKFLQSDASRVRLTFGAFEDTGGDVGALATDFIDFLRSSLSGLFFLCV